MKNWINIILFSVTLLLYKVAYAKLPSFATGGDISGELETKGEAIVDIVTLLSVIVGVVAIGFSGVYFSTGNSEKGKTFLVGGLIGIFIGGAVYGIAGLIG